MKNRAVADKLVDEMTKFIQVVLQKDPIGNEEKQRVSIILKTGDVLGALEVFTFANFTDAEQEIIFSRARKVIDAPNLGDVEEIPPTQR